MRESYLDVTPSGEDTFESVWHQPNFRHTLFGGQVLAQALIAACYTVEGRSPHSLHAYFLRAGNAQSPITYKVRRLRDGQSVSSRAVDAIQNDKVIFSLMGSFHIAEQGYNHQFSDPGPLTNPDELKQNNAQEQSRRIKQIAEFTGSAPIDYAACDSALFNPEAGENHTSRFWVRSTAPLEDEAHHFGALAFCSDIGLLASSLITHNTSLFSGQVIPASMDHSIWFHKVPDFNQWHQYVTQSPWAGNARALCKGEIFNAQGELVATVAQEGLIRPLDL